MPERRSLKRMPPWMQDPENLRIALDVLRNGNQHRMYKEISEQLLQKRKIKAEAIKINIFTNHNRGAVPAAIWLRGHLEESLGETNTTGTEYPPAPRKSRAKAPGFRSTKSAGKNTLSTETATDTAISAVNMQARKLSDAAEIERALRHSAEKAQSTDLSEQCRRILVAVAWGFRASEHNVDISYAEMSVKTKVGNETTISMVPGARISITVPVSSATKGLSEDAKRYYALAEMTKKALEKGSVGEFEVLKMWPGGRIDLILTLKGKSTMIAQKISPLKLLETTS